MPSADLRDCSFTGEPCAPKGACTVRGGAVGKGPVQAGTSLAAYSTQLIRDEPAGGAACASVPLPVVSDRAALTSLAPQPRCTSNSSRAWTARLASLCTNCVWTLWRQHMSGGVRSRPPLRSAGGRWRPSRPARR